MAKENPLVDTSNVTVSAFNAIKDKEKKANITLGKTDDKSWTSPNFKVKVKAWTSTDDKTHTYFHSLSIDVNVEDFMGTAELKCPYDSDLMQYWEPIRQTVVIYGANRGDYKILFIGRVRGVKQDGYELVIEFQNYGWKFKQLVTQSYANDNVLNKDGYTIMRLMFEALKIDSYVISKSAKYRLKQVGINQDGNLTLNGKELKKMPDLLKRLQKSDPSKLVNKSTLNQKLQEKYLHNIKNINYTLKYEKPTKVMKKIADAGNYSSGSNIYSNPYGSASGGGGGAGGGSSNTVKGNYSTGGGKGCNPPHVRTWGNNCKSVYSTVYGSMQTIWKVNRGCISDYSGAKQDLMNQARNYPQAYLTRTHPCLEVVAKYAPSGRNAAQDVKDTCWGIAMNRNIRNNTQNVLRQGYNTLNKATGGGFGWAVNQISNADYKYLGGGLHSIYNTFSSGVSYGLNQLFGR